MLAVASKKVARAEDPSLFEAGATADEVTADVLCMDLTKNVEIKVTNVNNIAQ